MKKNLSIIFALLSCLLFVGFSSGFKKVKTLAEENLVIESKAGLIIEPTSKTIIFEKNADEKYPIASMCKIMTLLLCFDAEESGIISFDKKIVVSENASKMGGSQIFIEPNCEYLTSDLIKGIVVASANDACVALAEEICGSETEFVTKMNEKAKDLGMNNTVFSNCTGLPKPMQYSTAKDVSIMFSELIKHEKYFEYSKIWTDKINHKNDRVTEITNTNKLVRFYNGCDGGKTGYTSESGHCLSACAYKNGMRLISVVISALDSKTRFKEVSSMFNYGFNNYQVKNVLQKDIPLEVKVRVENGKKDCIEVVPENDFSLICNKKQKRCIETDFVPYEKVKAPINKGDVLGVVNLYENNVKIGEVNVVSNENVDKKTYFDVINDIIKKWTLN